MASARREIASSRCASPRSPSRASWPFPLLLAVTLAACGDDDEPAASATATVLPPVGRPWLRRLDSHRRRGPNVPPKPDRLDPDRAADRAGRHRPGRGHRRGRRAGRHRDRPLRRCALGRRHRVRQQLRPGVPFAVTLGSGRRHPGLGPMVWSVSSRAVSASSTSLPTLPTATPPKVTSSRPATH